jgi:PST family polysaccharide transporter
MAQGFALYGNLVVEYGFVYSATRRLATASTDKQIEDTVAEVSGAKILLSTAALLAACLAYQFVPLFHQHPLLLWTAVSSEILKALLPIYYFYGMKRVATASYLEIAARTAGAAGIFIFVHKPEDGWKIFAINGVTAFVALLIGHGMIYTRYALRWPRAGDALKMLRDGWAMFLFRSAHNIYSLGNAFILGLFVAPQAVGYYSGAEKISSAATGLLAPFTTVLYPRAAGLVKTSFGKAAQMTRVSLYVMGSASIVLGLVMCLGAWWLIPIILGRNFAPSESVFRILSLRAPMIAWMNVLGFQWLLVLGLEKQFQRITLAALVVNVVLATLFAPSYTYNGMAWAVVISQAVAVLGIYIVLQRRALNPFRIRLDASHA